MINNNGIKIGKNNWKKIDPVVSPFGPQFDLLCISLTAGHSNYTWTAFYLCHKDYTTFNFNPSSLWIFFLILIGSFFISISSNLIYYFVFFKFLNLTLGVVACHIVLMLPNLSSYSGFDQIHTFI